MASWLTWGKHKGHYEHYFGLCCNEGAKQTSLYYKCLTIIYRLLYIGQRVPFWIDKLFALLY